MAVSAYVIAAICGNFSVESNVNPGVWENLVVCSWDHYPYDGNGGYGLGQWTNTTGPDGRLWKLYVWMTANGYAMDDGYGQIEYILQEDYWGNATGQYANLTAYLNSTSTDLYDLTREWLLNWEGIGTQTLAQRAQMAQTFFTYIQNHATDDPSQYTWINPNNYLGTADQCNNALVLYFYMQGYIPPGGFLGIFVKKKKSTLRRKVIKIP